MDLSCSGIAYVFCCWLWSTFYSVLNSCNRYTHCIIAKLFICLNVIDWSHGIYKYKLQTCRNTLNTIYAFVFLHVYSRNHNLLGIPLRSAHREWFQITEWRMCAGHTNWIINGFTEKTILPTIIPFPGGKQKLYCIMSGMHTIRVSVYRNNLFFFSCVWDNQ